MCRYKIEIHPFLDSSDEFPAHFCSLIFRNALSKDIRLIKRMFLMFVVMSESRDF